MAACTKSQSTLVSHADLCKLLVQRIIQQRPSPGKNRPIPNSAMATMHPNKSFIYKKYTQYVPKPGEDMTVESRPFDLESAPPPGGITVKNLYLSLDPYQRGQMRGPGYEGTYSFPWELDEPVVITTLAVVLKTDNPQFKPNDLVCGMAPAAEFAAVSAEFAAATRVIPQIPGVNISPATLVGAMGISGLSAYQGFYEYIKEPREGQTIFITAASGGVGQVIGQLAKMHGMKVIGSTGSQEKVDFVTKELGFDAAWNYKTESTTECLTKFAPEGLDVLYENVGGEQLETALTHMKDFGQVGMRKSPGLQLRRMIPLLF